MNSKGIKYEDRVVRKNQQLEKEIKRLKKQKEELIGEVNKMES